MHGAELLIDPPFISRAAAWLSALADAAPAGAEVSTAYRGDRKLLVLYGVGLPSRDRAMRRHLAAGGRVAMWDLGYWDRSRSMRLSIDRTHPSAEHLAACAGRPRRARPNLTASQFDPDGPILLCGLGPKSCIALGLQPMEWEQAKVLELRQRFPDRRILWRPKPGHSADEPVGTEPASRAPIESALRGCSLVVCRHSNVAIDACIAGVPVECEDGAAFALYGQNSTPMKAERDAFLSRLAWWNWGDHEAAAAWRFMEEITCD